MAIKQFLIGTALVGCAVAAGATSVTSTIDFNDLAFDGTDLVYTHDIVSDGFRFSNWGLGILGRSHPWQADAGNATACVCIANTVTKLTASGRTFDFLSIDLGDGLNVGEPNVIKFTFNFADNTVVRRRVTLDESPGLQTFTFGMTNLSSVTWEYTFAEHGWMQFDNVAVAAEPIPEPQTYLLMGAGLAALGVARRRKG